MVKRLGRRQNRQQGNTIWLRRHIKAFQAIRDSVCSIPTSRASKWVKFVRTHQSIPDSPIIGGQDQTAYCFIPPLPVGLTAQESATMTVLKVTIDVLKRISTNRRRRIHKGSNTNNLRRLIHRTRITTHSLCDSACLIQSTIRSQTVDTYLYEGPSSP